MTFAYPTKLYQYKKRQTILRTENCEKFKRVDRKDWKALSRSWKWIR